MKLFKKLYERERIHQMIKRKSTGTPQQLARKLEMSSRNLSRLIKEMKEEGFPIAYDRIRCRYYYESEVIFEINFEVAEEVDSRKVYGGQYPNYFKIFSSMPDFGVGMSLIYNR